MRLIFNKIAAFSLALIVLFSSLSFTVNKHICGGKVANTTLFIDADNCGMDMQVCKNEPLKKQTSIEKEPCCQDISTVIQGNQNNQQVQTYHLDIPQMEFLTVFIFTFVHYSFKATHSQFVHYNPPLVYKNIQTLFQIFRI